MGIKEHSTSWEHRLIDYTDGRLPSHQMEQVADHLNNCESCRSLAIALQRSIDHAQDVWQTRLVAPDRTMPPHSRWSGWKSTAAGLLLLLGLGLGWRWLHKAHKQAEIVHIQREIEADGQASRLLAAAELLARYDQLRQLSQQQYQYIITAYSNTPAADEAKIRLAKF